MDTVDSQALRELEGVTRLGLGRQGAGRTSGQRLRLRPGGQARQVHKAGDNSRHRTTCPGVWSREAMWHISGTAKHSGRQENTVGGHWGGQWESKAGRGRGGLGSHAPAWQLDSILYTGQCQQVFRKDRSKKQPGSGEVGGRQEESTGYEPSRPGIRCSLDRPKDDPGFRRWQGWRGKNTFKRHSWEFPGSPVVRTLFTAWVQSLFRN